MIDNRDFNNIEELTKEEFNRLVDENNLSEQLLDKIYNELYDKEFHYRQKHGESWNPNSNLCKYCRNNSKKQKFCWDCDKGSLYIPTTHPLFNLLLMYLSLEAGMESANNKLQQAGFRDAFRVLLQPFGIDKALQKHKIDIIDNDYNTMPKIEKAKSKYKFKQSVASETENKERKKRGLFAVTKMPVLIVSIMIDLRLFFVLIVIQVQILEMASGLLILLINT